MAAALRVYTTPVGVPATVVTAPQPRDADRVNVVDPLVAMM
jgi:hypothetical protein